MNLKVYLPAFTIQLISPRVLNKMDKRILIVEDEGAIAENLCEQLALFGYSSCATAKSYQVAINQIHDFNPDLIILDIDLEGQLTGIDVARYINKNHARPFIYHSGNLEPEIYESALQTAPFAYLTKPALFTQLHQTIEKALS
ncbi:response regulator receiver domain-containing protein [Roseivirga pacifica]|uniref:Response regulator receiver domain-containing protein n=2 Tax=Roseivirga pacifica TaxID=1267423 RepID=A0A1I0MLF2_9BACT|nr:response regulator receiver domain-containing protein [Roseivirga pacifica]SEV88723.1 Response regulator receiver domain-containing protein [Roseivirga pacifica]|tara:strand:+ start:325 stop:753 length:429 start_codon:yes stop_codon:yes gene_type:complete